MFFGGELPCTKTWQIGLLKNVNFNILSFKRCLFDNDFWPISLSDLNVILGAWNGFSGYYRESCDRLFFLKIFFEYTAFGHMTEMPIYGLFDESYFSNICTLNTCNEMYNAWVNWLRKHLKKVRSIQPVIFVLNWINHSFSLEYR